MTAARFVRLALAPALAMVATSALGASDYLLEIKGVAGEAGAADASKPIEISSFSWGASNPTSVGSSGMSAGKVNVQDLSVTSAAVQPATVQAAREASSGMPTGKRTAEHAATSAASASAPAASVEPKVGDVATAIVMIRESPTRASTGKTAPACATGVHYDKVVLTGQGRRYEMQDVVVTSCTVVNGQTRKEFKGHVTLLK